MGARAAALISALAGLALGEAGQAQTVLPSSAVADDVFYSFMPIAWRDSNNDLYRYGDFGGMTDSLDYLQGLGVTAVWMNPIFPSPAYHGYQHGAGDQVNTWFGDQDGFRQFVLAAHAHGIKVFIDFVAYETSQSTPWFQSAYNNPGSPYDTWLAFTNGANSSYAGGSYTTWNGARVGYILWNLFDPNPVALDASWGVKWLDIDGDGDFNDGVDGYRLDHVYTNPPEGWGATLSFWQGWNNALRAVNPNVFTFAEPGDWSDYGDDLLPAFNATFTKPFESAVRNAFNVGNAVGLYTNMSTTLSKLNGKPDNHTFLAIIGDHDVDRVSSLVGDDFSRCRNAAAILLLQPLPPIIYYGDEIGMRGKKGSYSGDASDIPRREPFKWNAVAGPPMSNYFVQNSAAFSGRYEHDNDGRSVEEQQGVAGSLMETYRSLIALRRESVALRRGIYRPITANDNRPWVFVRESDWQQSVLVAINLSSATITVNLNLGDFSVQSGSTTPVDLLTGEELPPITSINQSAYSLTLAPYGYRALDVHLWTTAPPPCGDLNHDGIADLSDLALLLSDYGCNTGSCVGDFNRDGQTDISDVALLLAGFGIPCH